jgi:DNA adenine methylase
MNIRSRTETLCSPLKWAGGKRWLTASHGELLPREFCRYFEPFLGGASVFLHLQPKDAILSDANENLIEMYRALAENWQSVYRWLCQHSDNHGKRYYYCQRANPPNGRFARAAWFLYMNRACYNGLYRVNKRGEFNVPKGSKEEILLSTDDFQAVSELLNHATLTVSDFEVMIDQAREGDFVYVDPPYTVKHNNNGFVKYNEELFSWSDQERLALSVKRAIRRGVMVTVSNADHHSLIDLYQGCGEIISLTRRSTIGGKEASRAAATEIIVRAGF